MRAGRPAYGRWSAGRHMADGRPAGWGRPVDSRRRAGLRSAVGRSAVGGPVEGRPVEGPSEGRGSAGRRRAGGGTAERQSVEGRRRACRWRADGGLP